MITLKSGKCSKDSCIIHAKLLGKRARFRVQAVTAPARGTHARLLEHITGCLLTFVSVPRDIDIRPFTLVIILIKAIQFCLNNETNN
jgi:hypothetical protein